MEFLLNNIWPVLAVLKICLLSFWVESQTFGFVNFTTLAAVFSGTHMFSPNPSKKLSLIF